MGLASHVELMLSQILAKNNVTNFGKEQRPTEKQSTFSSFLEALTKSWSYAPIIIFKKIGINFFVNMTSVVDEINRAFFFTDLPEELQAPKNPSPENDDQSLGTHETFVETIGRTLFFSDLDGQEPTENKVNKMDLCDDQSLATQETLVETIGRTLFFSDLDEPEPTGNEVNKMDLSARPLILDIPDTKKQEVDPTKSNSVLDEIQKSLFFTDVPDDEIKTLKLKERVTNLEKELDQTEMAVNEARIEARRIQIKETKLELARQEKAVKLTQAKQVAEKFEQAVIKQQQIPKTDFFCFGLCQ